MGAAERLSRVSRHADDSFDRGSLAPEEKLDFDQWCVEIDGTLACLSTRQVWMALAQGRIAPDTPVWRDGLGHWAPIVDVLELTQGDEDERVSVPERSEIRVRRAAPPPVAAEVAAATSPAPDELPAPRSRIILAAQRVRELFGAMGAVFVAAAAWVARRARFLARRAWGALGSPVARRLYVAVALVAIVGLVATVAVRVRDADLAKVPRAQRVAVDVADRARIVSARARMQTAEAERRFWRDGWQ
jgi:hypothetical protein